MFFDPRRRLPGIDGPSATSFISQSLRWGDVPSSVAPFVPTPSSVVRKMLELSDASADDVVYDLGCGDGRILFSAVEEFNVKKAVGYELNPSMAESVQRKVSSRGLQGRIEVVNGNFFLADLSPATVVTLYLTTSGNSKLRPKFEEELREGARVVSHDFPIHGWMTLKEDPRDHYTMGSHKIYLYGVPHAYETAPRVHRNPEEESRWRWIRATFLRFEGQR